jgi:hypothetical protein
MKLSTVILLLLQLVLFTYAKNGVERLFSFRNQNDPFIHFASFCFDNWGHAGYGFVLFNLMKDIYVGKVLDIQIQTNL